MTTDPRIALAQEQAKNINNRHGQKTAFVGINPYLTKSIPSPSLQFDFLSGIGGVPDNGPVEVFGAPSIGKSTIMGLQTLANAQAMGKLTGVIALEPTYDDAWALKNGVNPQYNVVAYPDNLDEAFEIYHEWVYSGIIDYILFDSLVGATSAPDMEEDAKARPGGQAKTITWNLQRTVMRQAKNGVGSMFINQQRDDQKARIAGMVESPGGWALKHLAVMRIHLKPGKDRYMMKIDGDDKMVGRQIIANFKKAKAHNALGSSARFDFYHIDTGGEYPFGVDVAKDVIATAKLAKVFDVSGSWLKHKTFPGGKIKGQPKVGEFLADKPEAVEQIRKEVLDAMIDRKLAAAKKEELKAV